MSICINPVDRFLAPLYYAHFNSAPGICRWCNEFLPHDRYNRQELQDYQFSLLRRLLIHARDHTIYYRHLFDDYSFSPERLKAPEDLKILPRLTKEIIRGNLPELTADNIPETARHESYTGGTRGLQMRFLRDNICRSKRMVFQWRSDGWAGWPMHARVAYIWPASQDMIPQSNWKQHLVDNYIIRTKIYYAGQILSEDILGKIVAGLKDYHPFLVRGFPSPLYEVAKYICDRNIEIIGLKGVISTGEPLYPHQRSTMEKAFQAPVYNHYAARESGTIAAECRAHQGLHLNIDSIVIEIDHSEGHCPPEGDGEILVTDLHNYAMPLIRYAIGDHGRMSNEKCSCQSPYPLMTNIVGRVCDNFVDKSGKTVLAISLIEHLLYDGPKVGLLQVIQESPTEFTVRLGKDPNPERELKDHIEKGLKKYVQGIEKIKFELVDRIEPEKSGKDLLRRQ